MPLVNISYCKLEMQQQDLETLEKFLVGKKPMEGENFQLSSKEKKEYWF